MEDYIKWLENKIEVTLEDKDLQREHWAFCQCLKQYRELNNLIKHDVIGRSEQLPITERCKCNIAVKICYNCNGFIP